MVCLENHFGIKMWLRKLYQNSVLARGAELPTTSFQWLVITYKKPHPPALGHRLSLHRWWPGQTYPCSFESAPALIWCACCGPACAGCHSVCILGVGRSRNTAGARETLQGNTTHSSHYKRRGHRIFKNGQKTASGKNRKILTCLKKNADSVCMLGFTSDYISVCVKLQHPLLVAEQTTTKQLFLKRADRRVAFQGHIKKNEWRIAKSFICHWADYLFKLNKYI